MSYTVYTRNTLRKDVKKIPAKSLKEIYDAVDQLSENPYMDGVRKVKGRDVVYRIRVGDYRVIYEINDKDKSIMIMYLRPHKDAYRDL